MTDNPFPFDRVDFALNVIEGLAAFVQRVRYSVAIVVLFDALRPLVSHVCIIAVQLVWAWPAKMIRIAICHSLDPADVGPTVFSPIRARHQEIDFGFVGRAARALCER